MSAIDTLYKSARARRACEGTREETSMMTIRKHSEQTMPWQPSAAMFAGVCSMGLIPSASDYLGRLEQETVINRRHSKQ